MIRTFAELTREHEAVITQLNNLQKTSNGTFDQIELSQLQVDFKNHCIHEEELMKDLDYPFLCAHVLAHTIVSKFFIRLSHDSGPYLVSNLIADIMNHINTYDKQFDEFYRINPDS